MTDEEKAAKEKVLEQDREKLRLYTEASALMKSFIPATAFPVGGGMYRSGNEWYSNEDFLPGGRYYEAAKASQNAPFKDFGFQEYQRNPITDEEEAWFADPKNWGLDDGTEGAQQATEAINQVKPFLFYWRHLLFEFGERIRVQITGQFKQHIVRTDFLVYRKLVHSETSPFFPCSSGE